MARPFVLTVGLLLTASGCSSSSNPQTPDAAAMSPDDHSGEAPDAAEPSLDASSPEVAPGADVAFGGGSDGASCFVSASTYDQTCDADSDCVPVPAGGNICDGCPNGQLFECDLAAVNVKASAAYRSVLTVALEDSGCFASCPQGYYFLLGGDGGAARCENGICRSAL